MTEPEHSPESVRTVTSALQAAGCTVQAHQPVGLHHYWVPFTHPRLDASRAECDALLHELNAALAPHTALHTHRQEGRVVITRTD
ncbi:Uncharacterised protein [uncultured archaeon]|nr:Uncharacterised protein [uncultured archaeon]